MAESDNISIAEQNQETGVNAKKIPALKGTGINVCYRKILFSYNDFACIGSALRFEFQHVNAAVDRSESHILHCSVYNTDFALQPHFTQQVIQGKHGFTLY